MSEIGTATRHGDTLVPGSRPGLVPTGGPAAPPPAGRRGAICFVANDFDGIIRNGGIGTYFYLNAVLLAKAGWAVHVLYTSPAEDPDALRAAPARLKALGVTFHALDALPDPASEDGHVRRSPWFMDRADKVRHVLKALHAEHRFDLIEFAEWQGLGFRAVQAKRAGLDFADADLVVRVHSCSQWVRDGNLQWLGWQEESRLDYCERYAFDHADVQLSPSAYMLEYLRGIGWGVRADAKVSFYPFPTPTPRAGEPATGAGPAELVFFGRLEVRKGLEVFLDALKGVDPAVPVTFLGKNTVLADGRSAEAVIRERTAGRAGPVRLLTGFNREQALEYVTAGNRVAVIASLADNLPFTVIECLVNRVPFLASAVGGIPELVPSPAARNRLLFDPAAKALQRCLNEYLRLTPAERTALHAAAWSAGFLASNEADVRACYDDLLAAARARRAARRAAAAAPDRPLVSVGIPYFNLQDYLPETLASLAAQTYDNLEVVVVNDGSTDPAAVEAFDRLAREYPRFRFVTQANGGIGAARNRALAEARGEFFIPVDADNVAHPRMVETFVAAMRHRPDAAALTCYYKAFRESADLAAGRFPYFYRPSGGPHFYGAIENVYGDANAIFRAAALRSVGGYETDRTTSWEDWECFVKLCNAGLTVDVVPEFLFYYRHRDESWMRVTSEWKNHRRVLRQFFKAGVPTDPAQMTGLWTLLVSMTKRAEHLEHVVRQAHGQAERQAAELEAYRAASHQLRVEAELARASVSYRVANGVNSVLRKLPYAAAVVKAPLRALRGGRAAATRAIRQASRKTLLRLPSGRAAA